MLSVQDHNLSTGLERKGKRDDSTRLATRSEWNYALGPPFLSLSEHVDGEKLAPGWTSPIYDDTTWPKSAKATVKSKMLPILEPWSLVERPIPILPEIETTFDSALKVSSGSLEPWNELLRNKSQTKIPANSTVMVDIKARTLTTDFLQLSCVGNAGATVKIICAESYERDMSTGVPRCKTDTSDVVNGTLYGPEDVYTTRCGANYYEPF